MSDLCISLQFYENNIPHISYYCIQIETTMEGDDETMSTLTGSNEEDPCSDEVLKSLKSIWKHKIG